MPSVLVPTSTEQLDHVRALMRAFVAWHRERHSEDLHLIDSYFDGAAFELELAELPGKYRQAEAQALYAGMGFQKIEPYYDLPEVLRNWLVFMELPLRA
jgi:hypothetical protein